MVNKVIGICFSDLHINKWKSFNKNNERLFKDLDVLRHISSLCKKYDCPALFLGDLFEKPKQLDNIVITISLTAYRTYFEDKGIELFGLSGNHDMSENNTDTHRSPSYLQAFDSVFKSFSLMDNKSLETRDFKLHGIPYLNRNKGFVKLLKLHYKNRSKIKPNILMIHTDLPGAVDTDGRLVGSSDNIPNDLGDFFKGFDLVLCGHIHKPQIIVKNHIYMLGSPKHQDRGDMGCKMGYWIMYKNCKMKFVPLDQYPEFRYIEHNEEIPDKLHYYIKKPKVSSEEKKIRLDFSSNNDRVLLGKNYIKHTGIKSKAKKKLLVKLLERTHEK